MNQLDDITLLLCIDDQHIDELKFAWKTWEYYKPEITQLKHKLIIYDINIKDRLKELNFIDDNTILYEFNNHKFYKSQRDAMLTSFFEGCKNIKTKFYLKIDTDCFAKNTDKEWINDIEDRADYVFISSRWGYTKNAERIAILEDWADNCETFKDKKRLNLIPDANNTIVHSRIISFFFIGNTEWTNHMSSLCWNNDHYDLPVCSQDTFLWYCAARGEYAYKTNKFKARGFEHTRLHKAKSYIFVD